MARHRPRVTVVGLGPAGPEFVGDTTASLLRAAEERVFVRTARHPSAAYLSGVRTFDDLYESAATFEELYAQIVDVLVAAAADAAPDPVVYAVPGSPLVAERSVELLRADGRAEVTIVPALSFLDLAWAALGVDPLAEGVRLVDAADFGTAAAHERGPFLVAQCWSRQLLSDVKLSLGEAGEASEDRGAGAPRPVLLHHLGLEDEQVIEVDWWDVDRTLEPDHLTSLWVPALPAPAAVSVGDEMARLAALMDTLRERCPWDRMQTHSSLGPHLVEECYEVLDALVALPAGPQRGRDGRVGDGSEGDRAYAHFKEELGDLLFQIVFHARLADEEGAFDLASVARGVHDKLVHRHPHVFGDVDAPSATHVASNWEEIKKSEKGRSSVTEGIPTSLPALMLATKLAGKARAVGLQPAIADEETATSDLALLTQRAAHADAHGDDPQRGDGTEDARVLGELLFAVVLLAQRLGVDAEQALRDRARALRAQIRAAEGVPDEQVPNR